MEVHGTETGRVNTLALSPNETKLVYEALNDYCDAYSSSLDGETFIQHELEELEALRNRVATLVP